MFPALIEKLRRQEDLSTAEAADAMATIMRGEAAPAQIAGLLIGLGMKGERPTELVGFAQTMRANAVPINAAAAAEFDTCGTGGDRSGTFNISTASAIVLAACGMKIAKHGNRSVSSQCGSADVLEALGVNIQAPAEVAAACLDEVGIAFLFAPTFHPAMKHAAQARKDLGVRTAFNLLGPLTNPARPSRQIVGVPRPELTELLARSLSLLGSERAWVVHGADGLDELSTTGYTKVSECRGASVQTFYVHPADFGLAKATPDALKGGNAATNAAIVRSVLSGEHGRPPFDVAQGGREHSRATRDVVLLNAGAALFVGGRADTVRDGITRAAAAIDTGEALRVLEQLIAVSNRAGARA
jgi:anthranilate phosphoribosyltransferase